MCPVNWNIPHWNTIVSIDQMVQAKSTTSSSISNMFSNLNLIPRVVVRFLGQYLTFSHTCTCVYSLYTFTPLCMCVYMYQFAEAGHWWLSTIDSGGESTQEAEQYEPLALINADVIHEADHSFLLQSWSDQQTWPQWSWPQTNTACLRVGTVCPHGVPCCRVAIREEVLIASTQTHEHTPKTIHTL